MFYRTPCLTLLTISALFAGLYLSAQPAFAQLQAPAPQPIPPPPTQPESDTGWQDKAAIGATKHMVAAAHPLAAEAGREILRRGGSAIDAAVAVQMVLNLVEPQSSGIGGGAFILHWDGTAKSLVTYDGRETAPMAAREDRFLESDGKPFAFKPAVLSGRSVGVPGLLRALELAHKKHGKLTWAALFEPAIKLAEAGFPVSPRLTGLLRAEGAMNFSPAAREYFFESEGTPRAPGTRLKNPQFAQTLKQIAAEGADVFYKGAIAQDIVAAISAAPRTLSDMTLDDLARYAAKERPAVCVIYRRNEVCGMGPPSSGGLTVGIALRLLEPFDLGKQPLAPDALHLIAEAEKLAYADRDRYMADSDFSPVPAGLLDATYLDKRRQLMSKDGTMPKAQAGDPPGAKRGFHGVDATLERAGTSHISIVDGQGNAVSMTTTIEGAFGSGLMVRGFLLNNELTDFSFRPRDDSGQPIANRVEPGKRPRSSMAPTLVFDAERNLRMVTGSPGGSQIILYVLKTLVAHLDWGADAQAAVALPNFGSRNGPFEAELHRSPPELAVEMQRKGHEIRIAPMTSGLHVITRQGGRYQGGADPRRDGIAIGD